MGKLARAGVAIGSQASADLDAMMERVAKWMMADAFQDGGNDFDKRFEAMERQAVMLSTYADLISLQPPGKPVAQSTLDVLVDIVRWVWEHYHTAGDRMQTQLHGCLRDLSRELHARGGATLLAGLMSKVTRPLMALTLRVAPPDPLSIPRSSRAARPLMAQVRQPLGPPSRRRRVRRSRRPGRRGECLHQAKQTRKRQRGGHRRRRRRAPPFAIAHPRGFWFRSIRPGRPLPSPRRIRPSRGQRRWCTTPSWTRFSSCATPCNSAWFPRGRPRRRRRRSRRAIHREPRRRRTAARVPMARTAQRR